MGVNTAVLGGYAALVTFKFGVLHLVTRLRLTSYSPEIDRQG